MGFHDDKLVKRTQVQRRLNEIVNRLNKSQVGGTPLCAALPAGSVLALHCRMRWAPPTKSAAVADFVGGAHLMRQCKARIVWLCKPRVLGHSLCLFVQKERFPDLAAEKAAWEKEQAGKAKAAAAVRSVVLWILPLFFSPE